MLLCVGRWCVKLSVKLVFTSKKGINGPTLLQRLHLLEGSYCSGQKKCGPRSRAVTFTGHWVTFSVFHSNTVGASQIYEHSQRKRNIFNEQIEEKKNSQCLIPQKQILILCSKRHFMWLKTG